MPRRNRFDIIMEILSIAKGGSNKTAILYGANLNSKLIKKYIDELVEKQFLEVTENGPKRYKTTKKGLRFLKNYKDILENFE